MEYKLTDYFPGIKTKDDLDLLITELSDLYRSVYKMGADGFDNVLKNKVRIITADILRDIIVKQNLSGDNTKIAELIFSLKESVNEIEVFEITLAIEPTEKITEEIVKWMKINYKSGVIVEFRIKPEIIAGAIISFKGKYFDYSFGKHWDAVWSQIIKELDYGKEI